VFCTHTVSAHKLVKGKTPPQAWQGDAVMSCSRILLLSLACVSLVGGILEAFPSSTLRDHVVEEQPAQQQDKQKVSVWMKAKTEFSRNILAGLTEGDFAKISKNAESLNFSSYLEVLYKADVPGYKQQINLFISANESLIRLAEEKNLLGATLAFNQLTVSCVQCHQLVRDGKK
jgi:hypothetical protein